MRPADAVGRDPVGVLAARYGLDDRQAGQLRTLLDLIAGDARAPTAIRDRARVLDDHVADSLVALDLPEVRGAEALVDLGSGAGLPGLPLAIGLRDSWITLVESSARKCAFLERAIAACGVSNVEVVPARAESWPEGIGRFGVATARALAPLEVVVEYAAPLLAVGGALVAWRGQRDPAAEAAAAATAPLVGMEPGRVLAVMPYPGARHRHLHLMSKVMDTPARFPRRPGMAVKRPLSGLSGRSGPRSDRIRR